VYYISKKCIKPAAKFPQNDVYYTFEKSVKLHSRRFRGKLKPGHKPSSQMLAGKGILAAFGLFKGEIMKRLVSLSLLAILAASGSAQYTSKGVRLLSQIPLNQFPGSPTKGSAIYGWTSPAGREYAVIGLRNGNSVVDITNPIAPVQINHIPGPTSDWHENVTLNGHCYAVSDGSGAIGIQIIDLRQADQGAAPLAAVYNGGTAKPLTNVHTIQADAQTNRIFANGSNRGFVVFDASNPQSLVELGRWQTKYVHDSLIVNYTSGPYAGKQIAFLFCGSSGLYIVDVTNPAAMVTLGNTAIWPGVTGGTYSHSGSITPDNKYLLVNDEFDEGQDVTQSCTTIIIDVQNLAQPNRVGAFMSGVPTIDHNSHLRDGHLFLSAYKGGVRIYDVANPMSMSEVGFFDTYPSATNVSSYAGNWGVYAYYPSGNIALSDMQRGLFVLDPSEALGQGAPIVSLQGNTVLESGGIPEIRKSDDRYAVVGRATRTTGSIDLIFESTMTPAASFEATIEGKGAGVASIMLLNRNTGLYDTVATGTLTTVDQTISASGLNPSAYMNATGQVQMRISMAYDPVGARPNLYLDMARIKVTPSAARK